MRYHARPALAALKARNMLPTETVPDEPDSHADPHQPTWPLHQSACNRILARSFGQARPQNPEIARWSRFERSIKAPVIESWREVFIAAAWPLATLPAHEHHEAAMKASDRLERLCKEYLKFARRNLMLADSREKLDSVKLRIHFVFPNLTQEHRLLLIKLFYAKQGLQVGLRSLDPEIAKAFSFTLQPSERAELETVTKKIEPVYMTLKKQVLDSSIFDQLTTFQRDIVNREFLEIPFEP